MGESNQDWAIGPSLVNVKTSLASIATKRSIRSQMNHANRLSRQTRSFELY